MTSNQQRQTVEGNLSRYRYQTNDITVLNCTQTFQGHADTKALGKPAGFAVGSVCWRNLAVFTVCTYELLVQLLLEHPTEETLHQCKQIPQHHHRLRTTVSTTQTLLQYTLNQDTIQQPLFPKLNTDNASRCQSRWRWLKIVGEIDLEASALALPAQVIWQVGGLICGSWQQPFSTVCNVSFSSRSQFGLSYGLFVCNVGVLRLNV